jgi:lipoate-protein ligase B
MELWVTRLGLVPYRDALSLQARVRDRRQAGEIPDSLLLLEHPPVYTKGRRTEPADLPMAEEWYRERGIAVEETDRGGRVTYHGPGQLVGYPIMRVRSVPEYVATMERAIVAALSDEGVDARVVRGMTGVWAGEAKIGSIGVHVSRRVTTHGFAINVANDLEPFAWVLPCGMQEARMTSVREETGAGDVDRFAGRVELRFAEAFGLEPRRVAPGRLEGEPIAA